MEQNVWNSLCVLFTELRTPTFSVWLKDMLHATKLLVEGNAVLHHAYAADGNTVRKH